MRLLIQARNVRCEKHLSAVTLALIRVLGIAREEGGKRRESLRLKLDAVEVEIRQAFEDDRAMMTRINEVK